MKKTISILGSTGSIGVSTLKIIEKNKYLFNVKLLSANKNYKLIINQIRIYKPDYFIVNDKITFNKIKKKIRGNKTKILNSFKNIKFKKKLDICISAIPGIAGLSPTILMTQLSKKLLIANKESIICGWQVLRSNAKKYKTKIIPLDSEHYSILTLIENHHISEIKKIYLTASGGPFLDYSQKQLKKVKPKDALQHPKWKMGKKITIDSSTLMNKILELIEAQRIFNLPNNKIDILIHPNSLVHAIVQFKNGLTKILYHETSMIIPIANAIFDKDLNIKNYYQKDNLMKNITKNLTFKKVDKKNFPIINLKKRVIEYPSTPIIINAANEIFVEQFLLKKLPFLSIYKLIFGVMKDRNYKKYAIKVPKNLHQILMINNWAKEKTYSLLK